jgi:hypothetical protein
MELKSNIERYDAGTDGHKGCEQVQEKEAEFVFTLPDGTKQYLCGQHAFKWFNEKAPALMRSELLFKLVIPK